MTIKFNFFLKEAILFSLTLTAGIFMAYQYGVAPSSPLAVEPLQFSWASILFMVAFFILFSFGMARYRSVARFAFRIFLFLIIFSGTQLFFAAWVPGPYDAVLGLLIASGMFIWRNAFMHNIAMILGIAGISALLGLSLNPTTALLILAGMSVYDIIAVYRTKHMVQLAQNMIHSGAVFGFLIPFEFKGFFAGKAEDSSRITNQFMILGSGDIGLPLVFAASLVTTSLTSAITVAVFSLVGLFITHLLFINQTERRAMAALPPIATASIIGYLISLMI